MILDIILIQLYLCLLSRSPLKDFNILKGFIIIDFGEITISLPHCEITLLETLPIGYMHFFDFVLNRYEKLFRYPHFQCDTRAVGLCSHGVMSGRALIYAPSSQISGKRKGGWVGGETPARGEIPVVE